MTPALREAVVARILEDEGGLSTVAADRGGLTNFGLTKPFLADVTGREWSDADVIGLTKEKASSVYTLWMAMRRLDQLPEHFGLAWAVTDFAVHSGVRPAIKAVQRYLGVPADGIAGAETQGAWHRLSPAECEAARRHVIAARADVMGVALSNPTQAIFARGWLSRLAAQIRG